MSLYPGYFANHDDVLMNPRVYSVARTKIGLLQQGQILVPIPEPLFRLIVLHSLGYVDSLQILPHTKFNGCYGYNTHIFSL